MKSVKHETIRSDLGCAIQLGYDPASNWGAMDKLNKLACSDLHYRSITLAGLVKNGVGEGQN